MNDTLLETIEHGAYEIEIHRDIDPLNPRTDFDCLGTMVCFHKKYYLGDKHDFSSIEEVMEHIKETEAIWLPVYIYDHSGITINTTGFSYGWDSGRAGVIFIEKADVIKEYKWDTQTKEGKEKIEKYLDGEIKTYDQYLCGEVYGYSVTRMGEDIDSCWGYYDKEYCISDAKDNCKYDPKDDIMFKVKELIPSIEKAINDKTRSLLMFDAIDLTEHEKESYKLPKIILSAVLYHVQQTMYKPPEHDKESIKKINNLKKF